ncbi:hypothetical protein E1292_24665 [Nonomuraea deserti]|uniref:Uncharacterized protein n=1 Tax=Nonomuraea deserti TaxID=1848322 RepID=A0A4R4V9G1_9ACTN|nr:hypothetical protein [Nonomuraea deserti]TDD01988.1 hypothetical protein E1292_24665 [Nonomuraea deserti]
MTAPDPDGLVIDADGRRASGRDFQALADQHEQLTAALRGSLEAGSGLPFEEIDGPFNQLAEHLLHHHIATGDGLRVAGDGQVVMADRNVAVEQLNSAAVQRRM